MHSRSAEAMAANTFVFAIPLWMNLRRLTFIIAVAYGPYY